MPWYVSELQFHLYKEEPKIFYPSQKYRTEHILYYRLRLFVVIVVVFLHDAM